MECVIFFYDLRDLNPCLLCLQLYHYFFFLGGGGGGGVGVGGGKTSNLLSRVWKPQSTTGRSLLLLVGSSGRHTGHHLHAKLVSFV